MNTIDSLFPYQKKAIEHQCSHQQSMLWLDMGLGKTVITLTSVDYMLRTGQLDAVVIVAPIRVCRMVWRQEALKWSQSRGLRFSMMVGDKDQRIRGLLTKADVYLINYENLEWLADILKEHYISKGKPLPFDGIVFDEISKCKNSSTNRVKALRKILPQFKWRTGLTGTPASNGYIDLHGQFLVLDDGARLGTSKTQFETRWYRQQGPYKKVPYGDTHDGIKSAIGDITLEMSAKDYNPLPDLIINDVTVELPPELRAAYEQMEREFFIRLESGQEVEMFNQAALTNKCLQFANGAMYPIAGMPLWEPIHDCKLDALEEIIEESGDEPILCSYAYRSDAERIMKKFHKLRPINLTECKSERSLIDAMARWKDGKCKLMVGHPACLGEDTQVLTERNGWISIFDVEQTDRVFDGIEFVSHDGCSYSGFKEVIDVMGITMTPDHKLLIDGQWKEAGDVQDSGEVRKAAIRLGKETALRCKSAMPDMWGDIGNASTERDEKQSGRSRSLCEVSAEHVSPTNGNTHLENLAGSLLEIKEHTGQELRGTWDNCLSRVVRLQRVLRRHVTDLFGRIDHRTIGRESALLQSELCVGDQHGAAVEQENKPQGDVSRERNSSCGVGQTVRVQQNHADNTTQPWNDGGSSSRSLSEVQLWEKPASSGCSSPRKAHVYDLVNCGPRHRFLIRNNRGEVFISHNSMGHGLDGFQHRGHTLVWFGLNWSLDLYEQFNARIRRQGQGVPVICHRILCADTLDQAQSLALDTKADTQSSLRNAIKEYRSHKLK